MPKRRIFIVDDEDHVLELLRFGLEMSGYEVISARNGREALTKIEQTKPDLVISDIMMPDIDGYELCKAIRNNSNTALMPFIFLSAKGHIPDKIKGMTLGADEYITKPFDVQELLARVKVVMRRIEEINQMAEEKSAIISGKLSQVEIVDVIQICQLGQKTGMLRLMRGEMSGYIFFATGNIIDARFLNHTGEAAVYRLMNWTSGDFQFDPDEPLVKQTIFKPTSKLLMEGLRRVEQWRQAKETPPSLSTIFIPSAKHPNEIDLTDDQHKIYDLIDGKRDTYTILTMSGLTGDLVFKYISHLLTLDLIEPIDN